MNQFRNHSSCRSLSRFSLPFALLLLTVVALPSVARETTELSRAAEKGDWIEVSNFGGEITVEGSEGNQIRVFAEHANDEEILFDKRGRDHRLVSASWAEGADSFSISGERIVIKLEEAQRPSLISYRIEIPRWMSVRASLISGDVRIRGLAANVDVSVMDGTVKIEEIEGRVSVASARGTVEATNIEGSLDVDGGRSSVTLRNSSGDVTITTTTGDIFIESLTRAGLRAKTVAGRLNASGSIDAGSTLELRSHSGGIDLTLPPDPGATLEIRTIRGKVDSDYRFEGELREGPNRLRAIVGPGMGGRVELETFDGPIRIREGDGR